MLWFHPLSPPTVHIDRSGRQPPSSSVKPQMEKMETALQSTVKSSGLALNRPFVTRFLPCRSRFRTGTRRVGIRVTRIQKSVVDLPSESIFFPPPPHQPTLSSRFTDDRVWRPRILLQAGSLLTETTRRRIFNSIDGA